MEFSKVGLKIATAFWEFILLARNAFSWILHSTFPGDFKKSSLGPTENFVENFEIVFYMALFYGY